MTLKKWADEGVDYNDLNGNFESSLKSAHLSRIDQLRLMQNASIVERGDDLDTFRDIFSDSNGYNNTLSTIVASYDSTNKCYYVPLFWVEIEATAISSVGDFAINNCTIVQYATGKWLLTATGTEAVQRAQVYKTLFYGTDGSNPRATSTYITSITALRTSESRDLGKRGWYARAYYSGSAFTYTGTFADTTNNTDCSSWSYLYHNGGGGTERWELPEGTTLHSQTPGATVATSDETGTDTEADEYDNPANCQLESTNNNESEIKAIILCYGSVSWVNSGADAASNTDFYTTHSIPLLTAASITEFYLQTSAFSLDSHSTDNIDSIILTAQKEDDGTNLITYDVSSDNGVTWTEDLSFDKISEITSTQGTQLIIKFNLPNDADAKLYGYSGSIGRSS